MSSSKIVVVGIAAGAAALMAGVVYLLTRKPEPVVKGGAGGASSSGKQAPRLDKDTMIKIFERITSMMQIVVMNLAELEQKVRQQAQKQGNKQISNEEMEQYLMTQFRQAMSEVEKNVYQEFKTTEEEVRDATLYYQDDQDFQKTLHKLKTLFKAVTGQPQTEMPDVPEHVTMELTLTVMSEIMEGINLAVEKMHQELQDQGLQPQTQEFKVELQNRYMTVVGKLRTSVHEKYNVTEEILHAAVLKYQGVETFQVRLLEISAAHRARLQKFGFEQS